MKIIDKITESVFFKTLIEKINDLIGNSNECKTALDSYNEQLGNLADVTPLPANSVSDMTDTTKLYVNISDGYIYRHNGSEWVNTTILYQATQYDTISKNYDSTSYYAIGDYCMYQGKLYQCITNTEPEPWTSSHWRQVTIDKQVSLLKNNIDNLANVYTNDESLWEVGNISSSKGNNLDAVNRLRTKGYISNLIERITITDGWYFCIYAYVNDSYIGIWNGNEFVKNSGQWENDFDVASQVKLHPAYKFRLTIFKAGTTTMETSMYENVVFHIPLFDKIESVEKKIDDLTDSFDVVETNAESIKNIVENISSIKNLEKVLRNTNYAIATSLIGMIEVDGYYVYKCYVSEYIGKRIKLDLHSFGPYGKAGFYNRDNTSTGFLSVANDGDVIPDNATILCFTTQNPDADIVGVVEEYDRIKQLEDKVSTIDDKTLPTGVIGMFRTWSVIGTSFDCGTMYLPDGTSAGNPYMGWEHQLARRYGNNHERLAYSGARANLWLGVTDNRTLTHTPSYGLPKLIADGDKFGLILITMGCNDATYNTEGKNMTGISIGTITDIVTEFPDTIESGKTFAYYYSCIICAVKRYAPSAKIVCCHSFLKTSMFNEQYNNMIDAIAEAFNLPIIAQEDDVYFKGAFHDDAMILTHPTGINYSGIATAYDRLISKCCYDNYEYFKDCVGGDSEPEPTTYTVTATAGEGGTATVNNPTVTAGETATFTATPNNGYEFVKWSDDSTENPHTITINADTTLIATFKAVSTPDDEEVIIASLTYSGENNSGRYTLGTVDFTNYTNVRFEMTSTNTQYGFNRLYINGRDYWLGGDTSSLSGKLDGTESYTDVTGLKDVLFEFNGWPVTTITFYGVRVGDSAPEPTTYTVTATAGEGGTGV